MDLTTYDSHIQAGLLAGEEATCGTKIDYKTEISANKAADKMNSKPTTRNKLEGYPCAFCDGWHIGRIFIGESNGNQEAEEKAQAQVHLD